jgi:hypothetical protein
MHRHGWRIREISRQTKVNGTQLLMHLSPAEDQAITARMAIIAGKEIFDRLFAGVRFVELDRKFLVVHAKDHEAAAEIEATFGLHIAIVSAVILEREVETVFVFPRPPDLDNRGQVSVVR